MKKPIIAGFVSLSVAAVLASATVENVIVRQQWPWSSKVNIDYILRDPSGGTHDVKVEFKNGSEVIETVSGAFSGDRFGVRPGEHTIVWDPSNSSVSSDRKVLTDVTATVSVPDDDRLYMVIDLEAGKDAESFPVSFTNAPPSGGWNQDEYKTTKLVMRRIPAQTFSMGFTDAEKARFASLEYLNWAAYTRRAVTLTKDFYIAIFETTTFQSKCISSGGVHNEYDKKPLRQVSYASVRGANAHTTAWPDYEKDSFVDKLNGKIAASLAEQLPGYRIDLPSYAQWVCACRGGVDTCFNNGKSFSPDGTETKDDNLNALAIYKNNWPAGYEQWEDVGQKEPNAFGLYDMHGNMMELIRDVMWNGNGTPFTGAQIDPVVHQTDGNSWIWACGGGTGTEAKGCICGALKRFDTKSNMTYSSGDERFFTGFRLACIHMGK